MAYVPEWDLSTVSCDALEGTINSFDTDANALRPYMRCWLASICQRRFRSAFKFLCLSRMDRRKIRLMQFEAAMKARGASHPPGLTDRHTGAADFVTSH
jgi:hypothetical protein